MKSRPSKLDAHAERLTEMLLGKDKGGAGLTYEEAREQLRLDGVSVSTSRLCEWWERQQSERLQARLLRDITSGASQVKEVQAAFEKNPAPELALLMSLLRHVIFHLTTQGGEKPENLELADRLTSKVLEFAKLGQKEKDFGLNQQRFQRETCELFLKWAADKRASEIANSNASNSDKIEQLGQMMFGENWKS